MSIQTSSTPGETASIGAAEPEPSAPLVKFSGSGTEAEQTEQAARWLMRERGRLVIGIHSHDQRELLPGQRLREFAGVPITGKAVLVTGVATFADFEDQVKALGCRNAHAAENGQRFFFAILIDWNIT